ncbi:ImmA/IrrE family metallo-endopeptidase [Legionella maceachernii]|uniref:Putative transcriptional regulator (Helix-turn-helix motif, XRE-like) n=1 Tax=Legionella maceachernii TaxID=466 RepID=A0A0W0VXU3_9GAMM|nr:ImmA/IrrE family metallo-endopeptidase [Legionella maceachernii]KTD25063.1 putative transcriptional regulator (helix-turn-helix motif, XRE-like) [Legionella maceachernii]SKA12928.1 Zn-dependent peptidase ImmA, M78 family [Legionella maceachernii]
MAEQIPINPSVLKWAREKAGYTLEEECKKNSKHEEWENGVSYPTYSQLEKLSVHYNRPLAIFFFPSPPEERDLEKSFRALSQEDIYTLSPHIRYLFRKATAFQIYLKELFQSEYEKQKEKVSWLNFKSTNSTYDLAQKVRFILGVTIEEQVKWKNSEQALEEWRNVLAEHGVYVFKEAFKNNKISGFCIYDQMFPIIFLNSSMSKNRQIFTLFHEIAHLIYKENYLDVFAGEFWGLEFSDPANIEVKCNSFAANFLIPNDSFITQVKNKTFTDNDLLGLAEHYKVSKDVIWRKLLSLQFINKEEYKSKIKSWKDDNTVSNSKESSGHYYYTQLSYLGKSYFSKILENYHQGVISIEKAADYANVKPKSFISMEEYYLAKV